MKDATYQRVFITVLVICLIGTIAHAVYAFYAYQNSSIIHFITKELW